MYKKTYKQPTFDIALLKLNDVMAMSGTGYDDDKDNVVGSGDLGGIDWS